MLNRPCLQRGRGTISGVGIVGEKDRLYRSGGLFFFLFFFFFFFFFGRSETTHLFLFAHRSTHPCLPFSLIFFSKVDMSVDRGDSIPPELDASSPHFDPAAALAAGPSRVRLPRPKTKVASACDRTVSLSGDAHGWRAQLSDHPPGICRQRRGRRWITSAPRENFSHHIGGSSARTHPRYRSVRLVQRDGGTLTPPH